MKPTIVDPPTPINFKEDYDGIPAIYWEYGIGILERLVNDSNHASKSYLILDDRTTDWMLRRIAYLKMKELIENEIPKT